MLIDGEDDLRDIDGECGLLDLFGLLGTTDFVYNDRTLFVADCDLDHYGDAADQTASLNAQ